MIDTKIQPLNYVKPLSERSSAYDFRSLDISQNNYDWDKLLSSEFLEQFLFNSKTKFPSSIASKFTERLEVAKNRGLGINALHKKGYTGKGATVAIIDQPLLTTHNEIKDKLIHYEEVDEHKSWSNEASQHGIAVSSILCGKNIGVAPDAKLVYFCVSDTNTDSYINAIDRVIKYNEEHPENKIHTLSISYAIPTENKEQEKRLLDIMQKAQESDIFVITTSLEKTHNFSFIGGDRNINNNLDNPQEYKEPLFIQKRNLSSNNKNSDTKNTLIVPQDRVTVASPIGNEDYTYYSDGGMSWAVPYFAGIYAVAKNSFPEITPKKFFDIAIKTGLEKEICGRKCSIINSENIIKTLEFENASDKILNKQNNNNNITLDNTNDR